jgi:hypothetical protein
VRSSVQASASRRRGLLSQSQFAYSTERSSGPWGARGAPGAELNADAAMLGGGVDTYGIKKECEVERRMMNSVEARVESAKL